MSIVEETLHLQRAALKETASRAAAAKAPPKAPRRVLLFGLGSSRHAAHLTAETLLSAGCTTELRPCSPLAIGHDVVAERGDLAIGFSHRGTNKMVHAALDACKKAGASVALISAEGTGGTISSGPLERCEPHTVAVTGAVCAATSWITRRAELWAPVYDREEKRYELSDAPTVLLGERAGEWVAREAALKLMEMAHWPTRVYGSEEFFHGPSWIIKPEDRVWHVATPGDARTTEIKAARRITADVVDGPVGWANALIELQWLALALALKRGVDPDDPIRASTARKSS